MFVVVFMFYKNLKGQYLGLFCVGINYSVIIYKMER